MSAIPDFVRALPQDADGLLRALSAQIDDEMLREIASADYGQDVEKHLHPIKVLRDTGEFVDTWNYWHPMECLELIQLSQPDDPEWRPGGHSQRGHWMRAFACASILKYAGHHERPTTHGFSITTAPLIDSLFHLGAAYGQLASDLMVWVLLRLKGAHIEGDQRDFAAPLLAANLLHGSGANDETLKNIADWTVVVGRNETARRAWENLQHWPHLAKVISAADVKDRPRTVVDAISAATAALAIDPPDPSEPKHFSIDGIVLSETVLDLSANGWAAMPSAVLMAWVRLVEACARVLQPDYVAPDLPAQLVFEFREHEIEMISDDTGRPMKILRQMYQAHGLELISERGEHLRDGISVFLIRAGEGADRVTSYLERDSGGAATATFLFKCTDAQRPRLRRALGLEG